MVTTDPAGLPDLGTWYLTTNPPTTPSDRSERAVESDLAAASVVEVVKLYGLRMWVEQSYKQVKHALGPSAYQVRSDSAIRRHWQLGHWQLVFCDFSLGWWTYGRLPASPEESAEQPEEDLPAGSAPGGKKESLGVLAGGVEDGKGVAGTVDYAVALLGSVLRSAPADEAKSTA